MSFLLSLLLFLILVAVVAFTFNEGTWTNAIRLINVVTAGLVAFNFFEPVARLLEEYIDNGLTYVWDFVALWVLFSASMIIFRVATGQLSRVKVRFMMVVDRTGSVILALVVGWVMVCFISATLHTAPLAQKFLFGGFDYQQPLFLGMHPDNMWLGFVQYVSKGAYSLRHERRRRFRGRGLRRPWVFPRYLRPAACSLRECRDARAAHQRGTPTLSPRGERFDA